MLWVQTDLPENLEGVVALDTFLLRNAPRDASHRSLDAALSGKALRDVGHPLHEPRVDMGDENGGHVVVRLQAKLIGFGHQFVGGGAVDDQGEAAVSGFGHWRVLPLPRGDCRYVAMGECLCPLKVPSKHAKDYTDDR